MKIEKDSALTGTVTSRKCPTCGHHEIGITTQEGVFYPLRPGTRVQVLPAQPEQAPLSDEPSASFAAYKQKDTRPEQRPWVPEPVKSDRSLRLKYGVMVRASLDFSHMNSDIFQAAYLEKLGALIEKEVDSPIAVILDQFFNSPHLAAGDPWEIALAMWQDLEEIRQPVVLVKAWMKDPTEENLQKLLQPTPNKSMPEKPATDAELEKELEQLTLSEFLSLL